MKQFGKYMPEPSDRYAEAVYDFIKLIPLAEDDRRYLNIILDLEATLISLVSEINDEDLINKPHSKNYIKWRAKLDSLITEENTNNARAIGRDIYRELMLVCFECGLQGGNNISGVAKLTSAEDEEE
jgi:hypothetical protein